GSPPRQGQDGPGRVFIRLGYKRPAIYHKEVFALMCLAVTVQYGSSGVIAHSGGAHFMDDPPWLEQTVLAIRAGLFAQRNCSHAIHDFLKSILHVFGLFDFVVGPFVVKAQNGYSILIYLIGVYLAIIIVLRHTFAPAGKANGSSVEFPDIPL